MTSPSRICYLKCIKNIKPKINLPHGEPISLGRSATTQIEDKLLSRKQIIATANTEICQVTIETVGSAYSGCNGYALRKGATYTLAHGDLIELRLGLYEYEINFDPPPEIPQNEPPQKKIKQAFPIFSQQAGQKTSEGVWESIDDKALLIFTSRGVTPRSKIAGFDMDGTLIKTKSGGRFAKTPDDWMLNYQNVPKKLKELHENGYKVVLFTNQRGISKNKVRIPDFKKKIEDIIERIGIPIQVFAATSNSIYRKPRIGMWNALCESKNGGVKIDVSESFFVGDAAGRAKNWTPKTVKDHSLADRLFALNVGLTFYTPEEFFLSAKSVSFTMPEFDPRALIVSDFVPPISTDIQEVILMVGSPGSGKSFFCKTHLIPKGYAHVNRDTLGSWQKCIRILVNHIQEKRSVVIDNTNPDRESRKRYIEVVKKHGVKCRCFLMDTSFKQAEHNNQFRELTDKTHVPVTNIVLRSYRKQFQDPDLQEGFDEIVHVPFVPKFENTELEKLYKMFLLED